MQKLMRRMNTMEAALAGRGLVKWVRRTSGGRVCGVYLDPKEPAFLGFRNMIFLYKS